MFYLLCANVQKYGSQNFRCARKKWPTAEESKCGVSKHDLGCFPESACSWRRRDSLQMAGGDVEKELK